MTLQSVLSSESEVETLRQAAAPEVAQFVINLSSSTTPMALEQPQDPQLRDYKFFVSRRREDGRERFRLHMGYFDSLLQAEDMLQLVRERYPSAWVGEAPGKRQRAPRTEAAPAVATAVVPATPVPAAPVAAAVPVAEALALALVDEIPVAPPVVQAPAPVVAPAPAPAPVARPRVTQQPLNARSNVREVMAALDSGASLTDSQVLDVLEGAPSETGIRMIKPEETGTFAAIKAAVQARAPVAFAIQLEWSVQPVDASKVPPLAIFNAYRMYTVEGSRDGRRWYGLRLGFFNDAHSAKQVAQYVRSEFATVTVVPVSEKERDGASGAPAAAVTAQAPAPRATLARLPEHSAEFKLFDESAERNVYAERGAPAVPAAPAAPVVKPAPVAKAAAGSARGKRVRASEKRGPQTLEETLEILGADALSVEGSGIRSSDGVKHLAVTTEKRDSRLGRLFGRNG